MRRFPMFEPGARDKPQAQFRRNGGTAEAMRQIAPRRILPGPISATVFKDFPHGDFSAG
jgi:hypothetical protein